MNSLRFSLKACGYSMNDLWDKVHHRNIGLNKADFMKCGGAYRTGKQAWWNDILCCLDEMGVDW